MTNLRCFSEDIMKKKQFLVTGDLTFLQRRKLFHEPETYCFPSTLKEFFKNFYFEVYDQMIVERFDQPGYEIYVKLQ